MSEFVEVKTEEMVGVVLNWATFCAVYPGMQPTIRVTESETRLMFKGAAKPVTFPRMVRLTYSGAYGFEFDWYPSSDWECGGRLLDEHCKSFGLAQDGTGKNWRAFAYKGGAAEVQFQRLAAGPSILIAACRAIVTLHMGDTVSVPKELLA